MYFSRVGRAIPMAYYTNFPQHNAVLMYLME